MADGLTTVLQLLGARGERPAGEAGGQADMFEATDAPLPMAPATRGKSGPKGGRPAGVPNRSTEEWCRYLLSQYRSPLTVLAELYSRPTGELMSELQAMADRHTRMRTRADGSSEEVRVLVDPLAVLKLQMSAAEALAPYVHKQQPKALEIDSKPRGVVVLGELGPAVDAEVEDGDLTLPLAPLASRVDGADGETVRDQHVAQATRQQSDSGQSDIGGKASIGNPLEFRDT